MLSQNQYSTEINAEDSATEQMIVFRVCEQEYCIPILSVREIRKYEKPAFLPHSPDYVVGAINIRGNIVTVLNMARYLNIKDHENLENRLVIIVEDTEMDATAGLLVDAVKGINDIKTNDIQAIAVDGGSPELKGLITIDGTVVRILKLNMVLSCLLGNIKKEDADIDDAVEA